MSEFGPNTTARTRILFVDDEPVILEVLALSVASMKAEWEAVMAHSAEEALKLMAQAPADVVVSDLQLPGMNGAQLLNEIMNRSSWPNSRQRSAA